jgi:hypothetical protein
MSTLLRWTYNGVDATRGEAEVGSMSNHPTLLWKSYDPLYSNTPIFGKPAPNGRLADGVGTPGSFCSIGRIGRVTVELRTYSTPHHRVRRRITNRSPEAKVIQDLKDLAAKFYVQHIAADMAYRLARYAEQDDETTP